MLEGWAARRVSRRKERMMQGMMDGMMGGATMWGMGLFGLLVLIVLVLAAGALIKYLFSGDKRD